MKLRKFSRGRGCATPAASRGSRDDWQGRWAVPGICFALFTLTFIVFKQTAGFGFVNYDDTTYVYENPFVTGGLTLHGLGQAFGFYGANWHPLTWTSHMLDCQLYGLRPGGHHLTNVLLHAATVVLLFLVLRAMTGALWPSAFVAAVFAIHPLRAESVAWVAERKDVLSGLFFVLTLGAYVGYTRRSGSRARYGLALLCFALGLMCKPMLVTLPFVLLLLDFWPLSRKENAGRLVAEKLPFFALSAVSCLITLWAQQQAMQAGSSFPLPARLANALASAVVYLKEMAWPTGLAVFYPYRPQELGWAIFGDGLFLAACTGLTFWLRRRQPWLIVGWIWYLVMLLPVSGIIQVGLQAHADRYTYLPQIGIGLAVTWLVAEWRINRVVAGVAAAILLTVLAVCAQKQVSYWQDSETLWSHTLACTRDNDMAHYGLGDELFDQGRVDEAMNQFQMALEANPLCVEAAYDLANSFLLKGEVDQAIAEYQTALRMQPDHYKAYNNLGNAFMRKGRMTDAIACFKKALQIRPDFAVAQTNLDRALRRKPNGLAIP